MPNITGATVSKNWHFIRTYSLGHVSQRSSLGLSALQKQRVCRWVQQQCQSLAEVEHTDVHPLLADAAAALRGQPVLLRYCAEEVATARHSAVFQAFLMALTRGGPGGVPRPIEVHAHSPRCAPPLLRLRSELRALLAVARLRSSELLAGCRA